MGPHRADLVTATGWVVELQHSGISPAEIAEREAFYGARMIWLFDASEAATAGRLDIRYPSGGYFGDPGEYVTFRWKHPRKSIACCQRRVLLDQGDGWLLSIRRIYPHGRCGGWGYMFPAEDFRRWIDGIQDDAHRSHGVTVHADSVRDSTDG
jgi:hypothetical protein